MPLDTQARIELLKKAREAKKEKARLAKEQTAKNIQTNDDLKQLVESEEVEEVIEVVSAKKRVPKQKTLNLELSPEPKNDVKEVTETIKIKAPKKKKIVKRIVEVEESDTEEEVIEEVVRVPKAQKEVKISRKMMLDKLAEQNREIMMRQLFP